ncbi:MAG TPA: hypothetical protein PLD25_13240 [Chloroflexota bacterium]|nr:hypothetical protein [Chloroflexota bacterium]
MIRPLFVSLAILFFSGCTLVTAAPPASPTAVIAIATSVPTPTLLPSAVPTDTATSTLLSTSVPAPTDTPYPPDLSISPEDVRLYPVPDIYAGEKVTFQILAHVPDNVNPADVTVHLLVNYQDVVSGTLNASNLQGSGIGLFEWAWDTSGAAGNHLVHIILDRYDAIQAGDENRDNNQAVLEVTVLDPAALSHPERSAAWITAETACCVLHVVRGTAAERDLTQLKVAVETAVQQAATRLGEQPARKLDVYLIDRVIGQGGYAGYSVVISYLDRSYASNGFHQIMTHEAVHILDRQFAPERINSLAEGVAVWASDGHYKPENIDRRAAALVAIGQYVPLAQLFDNFYPVQHEIGYLEAAGFVKYLIDNYGWRRFRDFYSDVRAGDASTLSGAVDLKLQQHFNLTLAEVESQWLAFLAQQPPDAATRSDLEATIRFYNVMRRYQQLYDPTAYFLTAWLPHPETLEREGNPADLTRRPRAEVNVTLEVMLQAADTAVRTGNYDQANILLDSIERVLNSGEFIDPLARNYLEVVRAADKAGFEVQQVALNGSRAVVKATPANGVNLTNLTIVLSGSNWVLSQ